MSGNSPPDRQRRTTQVKPGTAVYSWAGALAQFHSSLLGFFLRRMRNLQAAEDLSQEVYLRLLRVQAPDRVKNPQAYMYRVAINAMQEFKAREDNNPVGFDSELVSQLGERTEDGAPTPEQLFEAQTDEYGLEELIKKLPPMQRTVLLMATCQQLPHVEIARQLGISISTMRNHLYRALFSCRQQLPSRRDKQGEST